MDSLETGVAAADKSEVATLLRLYRRRSGHSQTQLAELAQMSPAAIGALEQGSRRAPYRQTIVMLANALGLSAEERSTFEAAADRARGRLTPTRACPNRPKIFQAYFEPRARGKVARAVNIGSLISLVIFCGGWEPHSFYSFCEVRYQ